MIEAALRLPRAGFTLEVAIALPSRGVSAVFGPSGCGKSTLLRGLAGLERTASGRVAVDDDVWQDDAAGVFVPPHRRQVGMVFQESALFDHLDVRGNIEFGWKRIAPRARRVSLEQAVAWSGVEPLLARTTQGLSGGERQRVALARALAVSPRLLLMDEPLAALDIAGKTAILPVLERLSSDAALPIVYVSHSAAEVARLADHLVLLASGRVVAAGPIGELTARLDLPLPAGEDAAVVLDARVGARDTAWDLMRLDAPGASFWTRDTQLPLGARARLRVLARDVSLALAPAGDSSILNQIAATVEALGDDAQHPSQLLVRVRARAAGGDVALLARVTRRSAHALGLAPGRVVWAMVKSVALSE